ncbi:MAG: hypothetical protein ACFFAU_03010 [Candidatus Hodarchaeota archaeon]
MLDEKMKELKDQQNYQEMIKLLRKHEAKATQWYAQLSSLFSEENPTITGILQAIEQVSLSITSLLRNCNELLEDSFIKVPIETEPSTVIATSETSSRERDDTFTLNGLKTIVDRLPSLSISEDDKVLDLKFWYILSGKNESLEISIQEKEYFGKAILQVLDQINIGVDESFSVSPLGFEAILSPQIQTAVNQIVKSYGKEFTLIKLYR